MQSASQELLKQYVQSQNFTSTADIMAAMDILGVWIGERESSKF